MNTPAVHTGKSLRDLALDAAEEKDRIENEEWVAEHNRRSLEAQKTATKWARNKLGLEVQESEWEHRVTPSFERLDLAWRIDDAYTLVYLKKRNIIGNFEEGLFIEGKCSATYYRDVDKGETVPPPERWAGDRCTGVARHPIPANNLATVGYIIRDFDSDDAATIPLCPECKAVADEAGTDSGPTDPAAEPRGPKTREVVEGSLAWDVLHLFETIFEGNLYYADMRARAHQEALEREGGF